MTLYKNRIIFNKQHLIYYIYSYSENEVQFFGSILFNIIIYIHIYIYSKLHLRNTNYI